MYSIIHKSSFFKGEKNLGILLNEGCFKQAKDVDQGFVGAKDLRMIKLDSF